MVILISYFIELGGFYYSMEFFALSLKKINHKNGQWHNKACVRIFLSPGYTREFRCPG